MQKKCKFVHWLLVIPASFQKRKKTKKNTIMIYLTIIHSPPMQ